MSSRSLVALAPIAIRYLDRQTVTRIAVVAEDAEPAPASRSRRRQAAQHRPPGRRDPRPGRGRSSSSRPDAGRPRPSWRVATIGGIMPVQRLPDGPARRRAPDDRRPEQRPQPDPRASRPSAIGILDWTARLPQDATRDAFQPPAFRVESTNLADRRRGRRSTPQQAASRDVPRHRLRRAAVHHDHHLRHVGGDGRRGREEQPGHGAHDQRRLPAPDAGRARSSGSGRPG